MKIKRWIGLFTLCCVLLSPFTVAADSTYNEAFRLQLCGDVDGSGDITSTDARLTLQYVVGKVAENDLDTALADVDKDGAITTTDARLMLQYAVGKEGVMLYPCSLPYIKLDTAPTGTPVPFEVARITDSSYFDRPPLSGEKTACSIVTANDPRDNRFAIIQSAAEWAHMRGWQDVASSYDEAFFEENALFLCDVLLNDYGYVLEVEQVSRNGSTLEVYLCKYREPVMAPDAEYWALGVVEIPKAALTDTDTLAVALRWDYYEGSYFE